MAVLYVLVSIFSGVFAGMGMGGGTFLIPMLSIFFGLSQTICSSTNIICFFITAIICFFIYVKQKLINFKAMLLIGIPAGIIAFFTTIFSLKIESDLVKILFGAFIIVIGIFDIILNIKNKNKTQS